MKQTSSNKTIYIIIGSIIVIGIIGFVGYKVWHRHKMASVVQKNNPSAMGNPTTVPATQTATGANTTNTSTNNQQIDQDMQSVQNSMNQLQQDQDTSTKDTAKQAQDIPQQ